MMPVVFTVKDNVLMLDELIEFGQRLMAGKESL